MLLKPRVCPGLIEAWVWVVVDEKARAFVKTSKTSQIRQPALPRAFPGQKHALVGAFQFKYDQNYGLWRWCHQGLFFWTLIVLSCNSNIGVPIDLWKYINIGSTWLLVKRNKKWRFLVSIFIKRNIIEGANGWVAAVVPHFMKKSTCTLTV